MRKLFAAVLVMALILAAVPSAAFAATTNTSRISGVCVSDGKVFYTDVFNKQIYIEDGDGYKAYAGKPGPKGLGGEPQGIYSDGSLLEAGFTYPWDIIPYGNGLAVSDQGSNTVRLIEGNSVKTLVTAKANLKSPAGLATDGSNLYIADTENDRIVVMDKNGNTKNYAQGISGPTGMVYADGALYVCETDKNRIVKIADGKSVAIAGLEIADDDEYAGGYVNGPLGLAQFDHPQGLAYADGVLYVADTGNMAIRAINIKEGKVTTLNDSNYDFIAAYPRGIAVKGDKLYVGDIYFPLPLEEKLTALSFTDVKAEDKETVGMAVSAKIINGFPDGTFKPAASVTRAEFVTMLSRAQLYMDGTSVINGDSLFKDVNAGDWYANKAYWAAAAGLLKGRIDSEGNIVLDPDATLPGNELAIFIERLASKLGVKYTAPDSLVESTAPVSRLTAAASVVDMLKQADYF